MKRTLQLRREAVCELSSDEMRHVGGGNKIIAAHTIDIDCWCETSGIGCTLNCPTTTTLGQQIIKVTN